MKKTLEFDFLILKDEFIWVFSLSLVNVIGLELIRLLLLLLVLLLLFVVVGFSFKRSNNLLPVWEEEKDIEEIEGFEEVEEVVKEEKGFELKELKELLKDISFKFEISYFFFVCV